MHTAQPLRWQHKGNVMREPQLKPTLVPLSCPFCGVKPKLASRRKSGAP